LSTNTQYTILVVDDNKMTIEATAELLIQEGYTVLTADQGSDAIALCQEEQSQVMILDYLMPEVSGEAVVRAVRQFDPDLQIVLQTGQAELPPRQLLQDLDIQGYHHKAEGPEKLLLWVDAALKSYEHLRTCRTLERSLLVLGLALEARNLETAGHTRRVVWWAEQLGYTLGLSRKPIEALRQGAYLHDLGKLCIPDAILLKPGPLNTWERAHMQTHTHQGFELAAHIPGIAPEALAVIHHHHERWDGRGYPLGLAAEDIPLLARVFSVCDVYDALISARPYKSAWSQDQTAQELWAQRGHQFDPAVVEAFLSLKSMNALEQESGELASAGNLPARQAALAGRQPWRPSGSTAALPLVVPSWSNPQRPQCVSWNT
jgi:response regulator RpfG family c-di-GMP phosphodiesterase